MAQKTNNTNKGFTLLELLIVMGILSVITTVTILVINPAEYMRQSRDSARLTDAENIGKALNLYQLSGGSLGTPSTTYVSIPDTSPTCSNLGLPSLPAGYSYACSNATNYRNTNGTGWIPLNFSSLPGGSVFASLPVDPVNTTSSNSWYGYATNGTTYETWVQSLESAKYSSMASADGGISSSSYEVGTNLSLVPPTGTTPGSITQTTDADFALGTVGSTTISGTGAGASVALNPYQYQVLNTPNLVSYWKLDNDYVDAKSGYNGSSPSSAFGTGKYGSGSVSSTATTGYVNIPSQPSFNFGTSTDFSVEFWINHSSIVGNNFYIDHRTALNNGWLIYSNSGTLCFAIGNLSVLSGLGTIGVSGNFIHLVYVITRNSNITVYKNDVPSTYTTSTTAYSDASSQLTIGSRSFTQPANGVLGLMDEVAIYNTALSSSTIASHYNSASSGTFTSAVLDTLHNSTFTTLNYTASTNASTTLTVDVRAGNTATPDGTWTTWQTNIANGGSISALGTNRYAQYRVNLSTSDSSVTPSLNDITINYTY